MEKEIDVPDPMMIAKDAVVAVRRKAIQKEMEKNQHAAEEKQGPPRGCETISSREKGIDTK